MSGGVECLKCLVCSTGHMTNADNDVLSNIPSYEQYWIYTTEYGWIFNLTGIRHKLLRMKEIGLSHELREFVMQVHRMHFCDLLMFDKDGEKLEGYATFNW